MSSAPKVFLNSGRPTVKKQFLTEINDSFEFSFDQIADLIEEQL